MKDITIKYWGHQGRQEERKYQCDDRKIDMVMRTAKRIDLSEVKKCTKLEVLNLGNNMLTELDISPLAECKTLTSIHLQNNRLTCLDLWPLSECSSLAILDLKNNRLAGLDLTPVFLRADIELDSSVVISADFILHFAMANKELEKRFLLVRPDKAPWTATPVIIWNKYDALAKSMKWSEIYNRILTTLNQVQAIDWYPLQRGLLMGLSLDELAGYDGDPRDLLSTTNPEMEYHTARKAVFDRTIELLEIQIENGGSTLFLEIEAMETTKASKLIPKIIDARKNEMKAMVIQNKGSVYLMDSAWFTYYGFKIMSALEVGLRQHGGTIDQIRKSFDELGIDLRIEEIPSIAGAKCIFPIKATSSLKRHIYDIIEGAYSSEPLRLPSSQP